MMLFHISILFFQKKKFFNNLFRIQIINQYYLLKYYYLFFKPYNQLLKYWNLNAIILIKFFSKQKNKLIYDHSFLQYKKYQL